MSGSSKEKGGEGRRAGRGVVLIALAKVYFMIAGAVIEFRLPVLLAPSIFGAYKVVSSLVSPLNNVLVTGTIQAVSRFTARDAAHARLVQGDGLRMHLRIGLPLAIAFAALAPLLAFVVRDDSKIGPIMLAAVIVGSYSFYAVNVGRANGERHFHKQAGLDIIFATLRAMAILAMATLGFGLYGVVGGWAAAAVLIIFVSFAVVGRPARATDQPSGVKPMSSFFAHVAFYLILLNLTMVIDQLMLKSLSTGWFIDNLQQSRDYVQAVAPQWMAQSLGDLDPTRAADAQVGFYGAVQTLARLSYQAILAATFVIFPLVSKTTFAEDRAATEHYVATTMRYSLIFATAIAVVFAANPRELLSIPYPPDYAAFGAPALIALAMGNVAFSIFAIAGTILNGAGKTRHAIFTAVITLALAAAANLIVIPRFPPGSELLLACACASAGAMVVGAGLGVWLLRASLGASIPLITVARVVVAIAAAVGVGRVIQTHGALLVLAESAVVGLVFLSTLFVTRELTGKDLTSVLSVARRRR